MNQTTDTEKMIKEINIATQLRHGCEEARIEAELTLDQVTSNQAAEGKGPAEGVETRRVSPNNKPAHEPPGSRS